ncbi:hypothetical protein LEM8419_01666 [Neolewinella maritima]|uniref:PKD domain-containing protein n=1 Tax=Neolewinella maritima TaxID=1383882 RepID=A0ABN8F1C3_9BACT|nr:hypothetical protein LEM8419_01666 [Neolewinella maritima]
MFTAAVALLFLLAPGNLRADHIVGGEFQYLFIGWLNDDPSTGIRRYQVYLNVYRDCIGGGACFDGGDNLDRKAPKETCVVQPGEPAKSADMHITVYDGDRVVPEYSSLSVPFVGGFSDVSVNLGNPCLVLTEEVCQELHTYTFTLELPVSDDPYTIAYQRCCRNESIRNLLNGNSIGATYFIQILPEAQLRENDSPRFNIFPPIAICINADFRIDLGAEDNNGDSLAYKMCDAKIGAGRDELGPGPRTPTPFDDLAPLIESPFPYTSVQYLEPRYNVDNQLGVGSQLRIDPVTGELSGRPLYPGTHVIAVCVEEWSRDSVPVFLGETKREFQLSVSRCGSTVSADLLETEIDEQGRFYIKQCGFGPNTIINESTLESSITSYDWELLGPGGSPLSGTSRDFNTNINQRGIYEGQMFLNRNSFAENCKDTALFLLEVLPGIDPDFETTEVVCDPEPVLFTDLSTTESGQRITGYAWDFGDSTARGRSLNRAPSYLYQRGGEFNAVLTVTDENGCADSISKPVPYFPSPRTLLLEPDQGFGCAPYTKDFINRSIPISDAYTFEWQFGDGGSSDARDPTHEYEQPGRYDVYLGVTSPIGCFVDTIFQELVDVRTSPIADFGFLPERPTNVLPDFTVTDRSIGANNYRYTVTNGQGDQLFTTPLAEFDYRLRDTATLYINQLVSHPSGCQDSITKSISLYLTNAFTAPNAFTPNGDGVNDQWRPEGYWEGASDYRLRIWNRWGELIFATSDVEGAWDGTFKGSNSPGGGYLWDVAFVNSQGEVESFKGGLVLIR